MYDVIIIGAGPAGISASLYLTRANYKTLVLHNGVSNLQKADQIDNYYGLSSVKGEDLYETGIQQTSRLGTTVRKEEVIEISYHDMYTVKTEKAEYQAKFVILATGKKKKEVLIEGLKNFIGQGVSYCAICDAFFYKNKSVAVIGHGSYGFHEKEILEKTSKEVFFLSNGKKDDYANTEKIMRIDKDDKFRIFLESGKTVSVDGIFLAEGLTNTNTLTNTLGLIQENGFIKTDENGKTNLPNFYVCGDLSGGILQISTAVYEGMKAALSIIKGGK